MLHDESFWYAFGVGLVVGWLGIRAWRRRRPKDLGSAVSPSWLTEHSYRRKGDDRQWK